MPQPEIRLAGVTKTYNGKPIIHDFNLDIMTGQFVTAIGASGSGKTTVLKLMNGLLSPDTGTVFFQGNDIAALDQIRLRRKIGYVVQSVGLFPHLKVRDNVAYVPRLEKTDEKALRKRVEELAALVQLDAAMLDRYPRELSGGQRQRVGIARALAANPAIILMDEPFGAVDDITRKALQDAIKDIHTTIGGTIFFITHDISEALALGTKVLVMNKGLIEQFDAPDVVRNSPATQYVSALLESSIAGCVMAPSERFV